MTFVYHIVDFFLVVDYYLSFLSSCGVEYSIVGVNPGHVVIARYFPMILIEAYICC